MKYLTRFGIGSSLFENKNEAINHVKSINNVHVVMTLDEYEQMIASHNRELKEQKEYYENQLFKCKSKIDSLEEEKEKLNKRVENFKNAVGRWRLKYEGKISPLKNKLRSGMKLKNIEIYFDSKLDTSYVIDTFLPDNTPISDVKKFFENIRVKDIMPELKDEAEYYRITKAFINNEQHTWNVKIVR